MASADLTRIGACADLVAFAVNADDTVMLLVDVDGPIAAAAGAEATSAYTLPDDAVSLRVDVGTAVSDATCDDVVENDGPQVDEVWTATAGAVGVVVRPDEGADTAHVDVNLDQVELTSPDGDTVTIEAFEWLDPSAGWLPG